MKLRKLITIHWGTLENREWEIPDTLLLTGESGSGRTTLLDAIQALLTAARAGLFHFNVGQDESTQTRRGGKEPRTLEAYALGQVADGVFLRSRATTYIVAVFSVSAGESQTAASFSAVIGVEARTEQHKAKLEKLRMSIVRSEVDVQHFLVSQVGSEEAQPVPLKELYLHIQLQLKVGPDSVSSFEDNKGRYLQALYGAFMGKAYVPEPDAFRAARSLVKAMAYKELGNVNDLVRDEILEVHDYAEGVTRLRDLMQTMARLKADAERLRLNIGRLKLIDARCTGVLETAQRFVVHTLAHAIRVHQDAKESLESTQISIAALEAKSAAATERRRALKDEQERLANQITAINSKLAESTVAQQLQTLRAEAADLGKRFNRTWATLTDATHSFDAWIEKTAHLLSIDVSLFPALASTVQALQAPYERLTATWTSGARLLVLSEPSVSREIPAIDVDPLDEDWASLVHTARDGEQSISAVILNALVELSRKEQLLKDEDAQLSAELRLLTSGKSPAPHEVRDALRLIEGELPDAEPRMLAQLIEPRDGTSWQRAIEGYMARDRFAIIVSPDCEAPAIRLVRRHFPTRSAKVVQGTKALGDTRGMTLAQNAVVHELVCTHPVAKAYLYAQYGRVKKVCSEEELRRTAQGLMEQGIGSRGYGMFSCLAEEKDLAFGEASRKRRIAWCEKRLAEISQELKQNGHLTASLKRVSKWFSDLSVGRLRPLLDEVRDLQRQYASNQSTLAALDTSSIDGLESERTALKNKLEEVRSRYDHEVGQLAVVAKELKALIDTQDALRDQLPSLEIDVTNAGTWVVRYAATAASFATDLQLRESAQKTANEHSGSATGLHQKAELAKNAFDAKLQEVRDGVDMYMSGVRMEDERLVFEDPPRGIERLEDSVRAILGLRDHVAEQLRRQESIGLADNVHKLTEAEAQFNSVFTTGFCFKVRDEVRTGLNTLQKLNRELKTIQFGDDTYELEWGWVPQFQKYFDFFNALDDVVETLESDRVSIFESPRLSDEHRAAAIHIRDLLLSEDQVRSERALYELADYRNYRRYDIIRRNPSGQTRLSTWGTGSGGELETPFYVVRAAVLAHALGHFGRDREDAPALRLMLSDEAFAKMDESRSRSVLRFLSQHLNLQLIVAMPTSKSGAVKPEFAKEFTFSKITATRDGRTFHVSEVQEKWLKQAPLQRLWNIHAEAARQQGKTLYKGGEADGTVTGGAV